MSLSSSLESMGGTTERPRRGSNAQPPDSKSVTLSIELRGLRSKIRWLDKSLERIFDGRNFTRYSAKRLWRVPSANRRPAASNRE